ncbi:MAG: sodium-dependent transporter [Eggerthellaceae bacterium]|nr:sodium-dependent transporter [Eggerthellaceae bacterium]
MQREKFASRLGCLLISAGCAIGLGNVWRFPYITGQYGGGAFVVMYLVFLVILAMPIMVMEFAVGRASQRSTARAFNVLEPEGTKWHVFKWISLAGNYLLMMFYTVVTGWMLSYVYKSATGTFVGQTTEGVAEVFSNLLGNPGELTFWMAVVVVIGVVATGAGLQKGVERITKVMMVALLAVLVILVVRSVTLPGAAEGLSFYLMPDFGKLTAGGAGGFFEAMYAAMGQAFFTLSIGIGSMEIFGSYTSRDKSLTGESLRVAGLDTGVALMAGLVIFPSCFAFGVEPGAGPGLVFMTLPVVFDQMPLGQLWCALFFLFLSFAALSTIIAVFENIMSFSMDQWGISRKRAVAINGTLLFVLSLPCVLGFNVWSGFTVPVIGDIQGIEDFIVSNNLLPIGALVFLMFCTSKRGWGWKNFIAEADTGSGARFPKWAYGYMKYVVPALILVVLVMGWLPVVTTWVS